VAEHVYGGMCVRCKALHEARLATESAPPAVIGVYCECTVGGSGVALTRKPTEGAVSLDRAATKEEGAK
jgi:hypothetical protein